MRRKLSGVGILVVAGLAACLSNALGDDGAFEGVGGGVAPSRASHVRMVAEEVLLDISKDRVVKGACVFVFQNSGSAESLLVGFPDHSPGGADVPDSAQSRPSLRALRVMVDGVEVPTRAMQLSRSKGTFPGAVEPYGGFRYDWVHVWPAVFDSGQTRVFRTEYEHTCSMMVGAPCILDYILTTGASWAGPIGKVVVRVIPGELRLKQIKYPSAWSFTGQEYVWTAENLVPTEDISAYFDEPSWVATCLSQNWGRIQNRANDPDSLFAPRVPGEGCDFWGLASFRQAVLDAIPDSLSALKTYMEALPKRNW